MAETDPLDALMAKHGLQQSPGGVDQSPSPPPDPLDALMAKHGLSAPSQSTPQTTAWQDTPHGFKVRPIDLGNGVQTVQREDGAAYFGPEQGNKGIPGWFDAKGTRLGSVPGAKPDELPAQSALKTLLFNPITQGATDILGKGMQYAANAIPGVPETARQWVNNSIRGREQEYEELPMNQTPVAGLTRGLVMAATVPGSAGTSLAARTIPQAIGAGAKVGAGYGLATPTVMPEGATVEDFAKAQAKQAGLGAATGAIMQPALEKVLVPLGGAIGRGAGWIKSKLPPAMQELQDISEKWKINPTAATFNRNLAKKEDALANIPYSGMTEAQISARAEADAAAQRLVDQLKAEVKGAGTPSEIAMKSGRENQAANNAIGHQIYDAEAKQAGNAEVPKNNIINAINEELKANKLTSKPDKGLESDFGTRLRRLQQTPQEALNAGEQPMDASWQGMTQLKSEFWKEAHKYEKGTPEYARYMKLSDAVIKDQDAFAANSGDPALQGVHDVARQWWRTKVKNYSPDSFEYSNWAKNLSGKDLDPEKVQDFFVKAGQDGKAKYFYNGLDENGRAAVRAGIVDDAYQYATGGENKTFSPAMFATYLEKRQESTKVFFRGADKLEIEGFKNLMRAMEDVGGAGKKVFTGKANAPILWAGAQGAGLLAAGHSVLTGNIPGAALGLAEVTAPTIIGKAGTALLTTPAGKRMLLAASDLDPGGEAMKTLLQNQLPKVLAASAARENTQKEKKPSTPKPE